MPALPHETLHEELGRPVAAADQGTRGDVQETQGLRHLLVAGEVGRRNEAGHPEAKGKSIEKLEELAGQVYKDTGVPPPLFGLPGSGGFESLSYYDVAPLKATLERLVDFDRINAGAVRFSVGAVNVGTGNFVYFDNTTH